MQRHSLQKLCLCIFRPLAVAERPIKINSYGLEIYCFIIHGFSHPFLESRCPGSNQTAAPHYRKNSLPASWHRSGTEPVFRIIQNICISYSFVLPHGNWQLLQSGTSLSFSSLTFCIIFLIASLSKFTFVTVVNSLSIMVCHVFLETVAVSSIALARPINAPVSSSCIFAVSAFFHRHRHFLCSWYIPLSVRTENKTCSYPLLYSPFIP